MRCDQLPIALIDRIAYAKRFVAVYIENAWPESCYGANLSIFYVCTNTLKNILVMTGKISKEAIIK